MHVCVYVYVCMYIYIYIHTYTHRERERERYRKRGRERARELEIKIEIETEIHRTWMSCPALSSPVGQLGSGSERSVPRCCEYNKRNWAANKLLLSSVWASTSARRGPRGGAVG